MPKPTLFSNLPDNACQAYINLRRSSNERTLSAREHCEALWRDFELLADPHFRAEFPARLHERWFEMYLTVSLLQAGLNVQCPKPGPDILLTVDGRRIWIEAVCATAGLEGKPDSVPQIKYAKPGEKPVAGFVPTQEIILRLRNALSVKAEKFCDYEKDGIVRPDDVQVVAINVHAVPHAWADMGDLMMRSLYGIGDVVVSFDRETGEVVGSRHEQLTSISKKSGAPVGVQPFIDGSMDHISAVIGSRADAANLPGRLGDDFGLYPNLIAVVPWIEGPIQLGEEWKFHDTEDGWQGQRIEYAA